MCYWACAFAIFYGIGLALAISLHAQAYDPAILPAALGLACVANFARNRTFHCVITAPVFLLAAFALALETKGVWRSGTAFLWPVVLIVVAAALLLERRFAA